MLRNNLLASASVLTLFGLHIQAQSQFLGTADTFAVLAAASVTNTGPTVLWGDLGVSPGSSITGFPPGIVHGTIHQTDPVSMQAQADALVAYNLLAGQAFDQDLTGQDLGGMTLVPGVYHFDDAAFLTGNLTLDAQGDPMARFDFQIGSTMISASNSAVNIINGGDGRSVFWQVGSSTTLGTNTAFAGRILSFASVTANTGATINYGSAIALNGSITMDTNTIVVPEPASMLSIGLGMSAFSLRTLARRKRAGAAPCIG